MKLVLARILVCGAAWVIGVPWLVNYGAPTRAQILPEARSPKRVIVFRLSTPDTWSAAGLTAGHTDRRRPR